MSKSQPPQRSSKGHVEAVKDDVIKLKQVGAIKEAFYPKLLANTVVVKRRMESAECVWISQI